MNHSKLFILLALFISLSFAVSAACDSGLYSEVTSSDGTDYMGVNTAIANTTVMGEDEKFVSYTFFTPRLNFTVPVNESIGGGNNQSYSTLDWILWTNVSASLVVKNGTDVIDPTNYTLIRITPATGRWGIQWNTGKYNESSSTLYAYFNRTFVKNVDDFVASPQTVYAGTNTGYFLTQAGGGSYGADKEFILNGNLLGVFISPSNYAVGWSLTTRTCATTALPTANSGVNGIQTTMFAAFGLLAVMLIVTAAFGIITMINGGNIDMMSVTIMVIGGAIILFVGYIIIALVAQAILI